MKTGILWKTIKKRRREIYGICAIWIVCFHLSVVAGMETNFILLKAIKKLFDIGASGVDIFLLFSGIGVFFSVEKHGIKEYYKNRFKRIAFPWFLIAGSYFLWYEIYHKGSALFFALKVSTIYWWIDDVLLWYVPALVILYLTYPILFIADKKTNNVGSVFALIISVLIILVLSINNSAIIDTRFEKLISRIPLFIIGTILGKVLSDDHVIRWWEMVGMTIVLYICIYILKKYTNINVSMFFRWYKALFAGFAILVYLYFSGIVKNGVIISFLAYMGDLSLEVYLTHLCILYFLNEYNWWINATWYFKWLIVIIATIVILAVYKMMYKYVYSHLIHKEAQL